MCPLRDKAKQRQLKLNHLSPSPQEKITELKITAVVPKKQPSPELSGGSDESLQFENELLCSFISPPPPLASRHSQTFSNNSRLSVLNLKFSQSNKRARDK